MHVAKLVIPTALFFLAALVMGALALQRDTTVPAHWLLSPTTPDHHQQRDYVYPELSCPQAPQPVALPTNWKALIGHHFDDLHAILLKNFIHTNTTLGMAVAVVYDQQILWSAGLGAADKTARRPVTAANLFRIGSISKVFADLMLLQLRDRGLLDLDDEIVKHFPEWKDTIKNVFPTKRSITWRQLGSHMAGLPRSSPCISLWGDCNITTSQVLERIKTQKTIQPIETRPSYSNFGFALLGRLLEKLVGQSFESYVEQNVLKPLNMHNTGFTFTPEVRSKMAVGYYDGTDIPAPLFDLGWEAPAGQMYSSVGDLCELMKLIFRDNYTEGAIPSQILDGQTLREWLIPLYDSAAAKSGVTSMGMPWENELLLLPGFPDYWQKGKSGGVFGYTSHMLMIPELKLGVAVLMNGGLGGPAGEAAYAALALLAPVFDKLLGQLQPAPSLPPNYQKLVGTYLLLNQSALPPIISDVSATVRVIKDSDNVQRLQFAINVGPMTVLSSFLEYHPVFNLDNTNGPNGPKQVILQAAVVADPTSCEQVLGGGNQLVYFGMEPNNGNAASLELSGLFWGLTMYRTKA